MDKASLLLLAAGTLCQKLTVDIVKDLVKKGETERAIEKLAELGDLLGQQAKLLEDAAK